ncbi:MAG: hypothetical protein MUF29_01955 [Chitinophagaceae bacterium]|jgi:hypothetical protein|nr:hypothetical protein [Chitinophagaceae bacterium]
MFLRPRLCCLILLLLSLVSPAVQGQYPHQDMSARSTQQEALDFLDVLQGLGPSPYWPMVDPEKFVRNLRQNLVNPERLYQGKRTNFCGYASLTYLFLKRDPLGYATSLVELYREGSTRCNRVTLQPGPDVRQEAGVMMDRRHLQEQHADQLWFLTLADQFKAYLNVWDPRFQPGKENTIWAAVTFQKFNRMMEGLLGIPTISDYKPLVRGHSPNLLERLEDGLRGGEMVLYVDRNFKRSTWKEYLLPSHFVVLTDMQPVNSDSLCLTYWDYGAIKELTIRKKVLYSSLRGYTIIRPGPTRHEASLQATASASVGLDAVLRQMP